MIIFIIILSNIIRGNIIIVVAKHKSIILRLNGNFLSLTKSFKYFLYIFELMNQVSNLDEDFVKQKRESNKKGVVGKTGITIPIHPRDKDNNPISKKIYFIEYTPVMF